MQNTRITYNEEELIASLQQKDSSAFTYLYENYNAALYTVVCQFIKDEEMANDVLQEVFVTAYSNFSKYSTEKGRLFTWLHTITRNTAINKLRSKEFKNQEKNQTLTDVVYNNSNHAIENNIDNIGLRKHISKLKEDNKNVITLTYLEGFKQEEVANILSIPLGTVKTRLRAALVELKKTFV
jgi:RNA polymerase sigma factor (sigma-70 family)